jgi:ABC-type multidrug transport system ATPase subunit
MLTTLLKPTSGTVRIDGLDPVREPLALLFMALTAVVFIGVTHLGFMLDLSVLFVLAALFLVLGAWAFSRIEV